MIYLICAQNKDKELLDISRPKTVDTHFWQYVLKITNHRNVLYSYDFYKKSIKQILPNRVNVIYTIEDRKSIPPIMNAIIETRVNQIVSLYGNKGDDIYIIGDRQLIDLFARKSDFLIVYSTNEVVSDDISIFDSINFGDYSILKKEQIDEHQVEFYVKVKNSLGL